MNEEDFRFKLKRTDDLFMKQFKYFKSNNPKPSLSTVLTADETCCGIAKVTPATLAQNEDPRTLLLGLNRLSDWETFTIYKHPGLLVIKNPFTAAGQRFWIRQCLEIYPRKPNKINIDIETDVHDWWAECHKTNPYNKVLLKKLRWATLGYHHNWDTKEYSEENKSRFPAELGELVDIVACYLGYTSFKAQAAIVNYYHMNSTLSAHTDHSEVNLDAPLFSFSFGQSAIFLIGGKEKSVQPSAILIKSGDIVVMSKESRLCYHAVPKILPTNDYPWSLDNNIATIINCDSNYSTNEDFCKINSKLTDSKWSQFESYVKESRINVNVRQVLNENQQYL